VANSAVTGGKGGGMPRQPNHGEVASPNTIASTFFFTVKLLPKKLRFESKMGCQTCFFPWAPSNLGTPLMAQCVHPNTAVKIKNNTFSILSWHELY